MLTVNSKSFHSDPSGLYFFPEFNLPEYSMWHQKTYRFIVTLKPGIKVLDLPKIGNAELNRLVAMMDVTETFQDYITRYPPENHQKKVKMAWEMMKNNNSYGIGKGSKWNKAFRDLGYDAVFDDAGIIHYAEPIQLIVLNPRAINIIDRETMKLNMFQKISDITKEIVEMCKPYGDVTVEGPKMMAGHLSGGKKTLRARVDVHKTNKNYAAITIGKYDDDRHMIRVSLQYSEPRLNYGSGASFDAAANKWQFDGLKGLARDLVKIFSDETTEVHEHLKVSQDY